jgi:hypothetical protein
MLNQVVKVMVPEQLGPQKRKVTWHVFLCEIFSQYDSGELCGPWASCVCVDIAADWLDHVLYLYIYFVCVDIVADWSDHALYLYIFCLGRSDHALYLYIYILLV